jgi:hypothetical protein
LEVSLRSLRATTLTVERRTSDEERRWIQDSVTRNYWDTVLRKIERDGYARESARDLQRRGVDLETEAQADVFALGE